MFLCFGNNDLFYVYKYQLVGILVRHIFTFRNAHKKGKRAENKI